MEQEIEVKYFVIPGEFTDRPGAQYRLYYIGHLNYRERTQRNIQSILSCIVQRVFGKNLMLHNYIIANTFTNLNKFN